jgi:hypothetical protein
MFEVRVYCEDSKLQKVMWALDGIVVGMPQVIPVRGAKATPNKKKVMSIHTGGTNVSRFTQAVWALDGDETTAKELVPLGEEVGAKSKGSVASMIASAVDQGLLKRIEKGRYQIIRK